MSSRFGNSKCSGRLRIGIGFLSRLDGRAADRADEVFELRDRPFKAAEFLQTLGQRGPCPLALLRNQQPRALGDQVTSGVAGHSSRATSINTPGICSGLLT